jgi:predicted RNA-binding protein with PUA-like domain
MRRWLIKSDPDEYGFDDLLRDRKTVWDGVRNPQALIYLREMKQGDEVLFYHTGREKQIVGEAVVAKGAYPDPSRRDEKLVVIELTAGARWAAPVSLSAIKADDRFAELALVKHSRLSVMPIPDPSWRILAAIGSR